MSADEIRQLLRTEPFQPFVVHGPQIGSVRVPARRQAMLTPDGRIFVVNPEGDTVELIDVPLITSISVENPAESANTQR
jgi:hypothetical protein